MPCLEAAASTGLERVFRNYPYGPADGVTHTLKKHGLTREIANVMLEIRNDLISDDAGQAAMGRTDRRASCRFTGTAENRTGDVLMRECANAVEEKALAGSGG
jgi:hypothetical protein